MRIHQLYVRTDGPWEWLCTIDAATHAQVFHRAIACPGDDYYEKPIRLEQDTEGACRTASPVAGHDDRH